MKNVTSWVLRAALGFLSLSACSEPPEIGVLVFEDGPRARRDEPTKAEDPPEKEARVTMMAVGHPRGFGLGSAEELETYDLPDGLRLRDASLIGGAPGEVRGSFVATDSEGEAGLLFRLAAGELAEIGAWDGALGVVASLAAVPTAIAAATTAPLMVVVVVGVVVVGVGVVSVADRKRADEQRRQHEEARASQEGQRHRSGARAAGQRHSTATRTTAVHSGRSPASEQGADLRRDARTDQLTLRACRSRSSRATGLRARILRCAVLRALCEERNTEESIDARCQSQNN